jgi:hypothetical protein
MNRVRRRVGDAKVNRLIVAFLKAGVLSEEQLLRTENGTPQGGILSPLLANIALSIIEERYERHVWPRRARTPLITAEEKERWARTYRQIDRRRRPVFYPIRYADDVIILVSAPCGPSQYQTAERLAHEEKAALATMLRERLNLELSETKTLVTPVTQPIRFLGHHVYVRVHPFYRREASMVVIPKDRSQRVRELIKDLFKGSTVQSSLRDRLRRLNYLLRGWGNFYRHAAGAKKVFASLDHYVWWTILRWLRKKHYPTGVRVLFARYAGHRRPRGRIIWRDGGVAPHRLAGMRTEPFKLGWMKTPDFV